jgi:hypothetical protein
MVKKVTRTVTTIVDNGKKKKTIRKKTTSSPVKKKIVKKTKKKVVKKKAPRKIKAHNSAPTKDFEKREKMLVENFVGLQHAMTNLSIKFGEMSQNISKLLSVFEEAAKDLAKTEKQVDSSFEKKLDSLIDQNKTIAKGLVLMDNKLKGQMSRGPAPERTQQRAPAPRNSMQTNRPQNLQAPQGQLSQQSFPQASVNKPKPLPKI